MQSSHVALSEDIHHVEQLFLRARFDLFCKKKRCVDRALGVDLPAPHVVLECEGHGTIL